MGHDRVQNVNVTNVNTTVMAQQVNNYWFPDPFWPPVDPFLGGPPYRRGYEFVPPLDPFLGRPPIPPGVDPFWPPVDPYLNGPPVFRGGPRYYPGTPPFVPGPHPYYDSNPWANPFSYEHFGFSYRDYDGGFRFGYRSGPGFEGFNFGFDFNGGRFDFGYIEPRFPFY